MGWLIGMQSWSLTRTTSYVICNVHTELQASEAGLPVWLAKACGTRAQYLSTRRPVGNRCLRLDGGFRMRPDGLRASGLVCVVPARDRCGDHTASIVCEKRVPRRWSGQTVLGMYPLYTGSSDLLRSERVRIFKPTGFAYPASRNRLDILVRVHNPILCQTQTLAFES